MDDYDLDKIVGLYNFGNTCFINSALQLLMSCKEMVTLFLSHDFSGNEIFKYQQTFKDYFRKTTNYLGPKILYNRYKSLTASYDGYTQEDAHEYLTFLIDDLDTLLTDNILKEKFKKQIKVQMSGNIKCSHCGFFKSWSIPENILSLSVNSHSSLLDSLHDLTKIEKLEGDNQWDCDKCHCKRDAKKMITINHFPKYLFISLNRYVYENGQMERNNHVMDIPFSWSDYVIHGLVCHVGNMQGGHYFSFIHRNNKWFFVNDKQIKEVEWGEVQKSFPLVYILLYTRI